MVHQKHSDYKNIIPQESNQPLASENAISNEVSKQRDVTRDNLTSTDHTGKTEEKEYTAGDTSMIT